MAEDVELPVDLDWSADARCLLTDAPADLHRVTLRRMVFLGVLWAGEQVTLPLPLARRPLLVPWQYLRMLGPALCLLAAAPLVFSEAAHEAAAAGVDPRPRVAAAALLALAAWLGLRALLGHLEPIRLVGVSRDRRTACVRFADPEAARRSLAWSRARTDRRAPPPGWASA